MPGIRILWEIRHIFRLKYRVVYDIILVEKRSQKTVGRHFFLFASDASRPGRIIIMSDMLRRKPKTLENRRIKKQNFAAAAVIVCLFCWYYFLIQRGFNTVDEGFYYTLPWRLLNGDKLFVDEWHVSQLSALFLLVPMKLFHVVTGSFDGIILFFRHLYLLTHTAAAVYLYAAARRYGYRALGAVTVFFVFAPFNIYAFNYYNVYLTLSAVVAAGIFIRKKLRPAEYVVCGFLFALSVVDEPFTAPVYFLYTAAVIILRVKKQSSAVEKYEILDFGTWRKLTAGIGIAVVVFVPVFLRFTDLSRLPLTFSELFNDSEYAFIMPDGTVSVFRFFVDAVRYYGAPCIVCFILWFVLFGIVTKRARKFSVILLPAAFVIAVAASVSLFIHVLRGSPVRISVYRLVLLFLGGAALCCMKKRDPKLTACWLFGFVSTVLLDISSDVSVAFFSGVSDISLMLMLPDMTEQARGDAVALKQYSRYAHLSVAGFLREKKIPAGVRLGAAMPSVIFAFVCALCLTVSAGSAFYYFAETSTLISPSALNVTLESGPYKGVRTTEEVRAVYEGELRDYAVIAENSGGGYLYVISDESWPYIYAGMPCGAYSTWFVDQDYYFRQPVYWSIFPEKLPEYMYLPKYNRFFPNKDIILSDALRFASCCCECEVTETETGYIIKTGEWHLERLEDFRPEYNEFEE